LLDDTKNRCGRSIDVMLRRRPVADRNPHGSPALPLCGSQPAGAVSLHACDNLHGERAFIARITTQWNKLHQHLVQHDVIQRTNLNVLAECFGHPSSMTTATFHEFTHTAPSERP
jgi:hypothetical protein